MTPEEREAFKQEIIQYVYGKIPIMVEILRAEQDTLKELAANFYKEYPELQEFRGLVTIKIAELVAEFPEKDLKTEILPMVAKEVTQSMGKIKQGLLSNPNIDNLAKELVL